MRTLLLLAVAGAVGTLARHGVGVLTRQLAGDTFPWSTWVVNLTGCLLFGWVVARHQQELLQDETRLALLVGFAGAFTTFSTLAYDTVALARAGRVPAAVVNIILQNLCGVMAILGGLVLGRVRGG
jgi:CrcB protein